MRIVKLALILALAVAAAWAAEPPTFSEDVAPILFENCTQCHRPGQAGPFALETYEDAQKRGAFLAAVAASRYMPPWHAGEADIAYAGDRRLTDEEITTLKEWVDAGMPQGDPSKAPGKPGFSEGWELGEPTVTATMSEPFEVPADGPDIYEYFVLDIPIDEPQWIRAIEYQPGARTVVHHVLGFLVPGEKLEARRGRDFGGLTNDGNRVLTWAVGTNPRVLPEGVGVRVDPGTKLLVQTHFHPSGKKESEVSRVGFHLADEDPGRRYIEVQVPPAFGQLSAIEVPAGSDGYTLQESFEMPVDVTAFATFAHAHYIGKEFHLAAEFPNGEKKELLNIPAYDFAWQEYYYLAEPLDIPAGTKLHASIRWDNRAENPANPYDPPRDIKWGLYSEDEMGSVILDVVTKDPADEAAMEKAMAQRKALSAAQFYLSSNGQFFRSRRNAPPGGAKRMAEIVLKPFDKNGDGKITGTEEEAAWDFLQRKGLDRVSKRGGSE